MKKLVSILLCMVMVMSLLAGCAKKADSSTEGKEGSSESSKTETVTDEQDIVIRIAWWGNQTRDERTEAVLNLYTELNPHVTFEMEPIGWSGYWDKLATQTAGGSLPDIVQQDYAYIGQYIERDVLADLTPFIESGVLNLDNVSDSILEGGKQDGGLYGIPLGMNALSFIYNKEALAEAGYDSIDPDWSWDDYKEMILKMYTDNDMRSDAPLWDDPKFLFEYMLRQNGQALYNEDGNGLGFSDTVELEEMFGLLKDMIEAGVYPKPEEIAAIKTLEEAFFVNEKTTNGIIWSNFFVAYTNSMEAELALTVLPNAGDQSGLYLKPSQFFSVTESSEHKEEAVKVIDFITNSIEANNILLAERGIPVASQVREGIKENVSAEVAKTFDYIELAEQYATPIASPEPTGAAEVTKLLKSLFEEVAYGVTTPEDAATRFIEEANGILSIN